MRNYAMSNVTSDNITSVNASPMQMLSLEHPVSVGKLSASTWQMPKGNAMTLLYVETSTNFILDGEPHHTATGEVLLLSPNSKVNSLTGSVWQLSFQLDLLSTLGEGLGDTFARWSSLSFLAVSGLRRYSVAAPQVWLTSLKALEGELTAQDLGYCETSKAYLALLIVQLARLAEKDLEVAGDSDHPLIGKVVSYIDQNYTEPISLSSVAKRFHRSAPYLTTLFREEIGRSLNDCILERRTEEARRLLRHSGLSIAEVGERVGYPEPTHFSRLFRKRVGISPTAFRNGERNVKSG